ncbi:MAG: nucleotidyltransferase family protein [SAR324 cluster bacterium]|nr:nucleotidyltransferase family protein [SAR324 cluster bacterium]
MTGLDQVRSKWKTDILRLAAEHGARNIRVFGSVARGEGTDMSDLDLLIELEPGRSLFDLIGFEHALEDLLGCKVDVLTDGGVSPYFREYIYRDATPL